jgi:CubicO group peptidase (beta-lactamase class C family)
MRNAALSFCLIPALLVALCHLPSRQATAQTTAITAPVTLPDTPAGKRFSAWLAAVNAGNRDTLRQFIGANFAPPPNGTLPVDGIANRHFGIYTNTRGLEIGKVVVSSPERITVALQSKRTGYWMQIGLAVTAEPPHNILGFGFRNAEAPADLLPRTKLTEREIRERTDKLIDRLVAADEFAGVILVAKDVKPIYQRAVGMASRAWNVPNRVDTKFNIASIGKMFTAVAVAQLVEQGKLSYEDTLEKALPDYPNQEIARKVTVRHLLTHTSGLTEARGPAAGDNSFRRGFRTIKEYMTGSANDTLKFDPGTKLEYSNYGYLVLGAIIEKASGQDYFTYIREHIYKPAGMTNSDSYELDTDPPNLATGYMDAPGGTRLSNIFRLPVKGLPSGLGYATAGDLVKFAMALREHKLLTAASLHTVWTGVMDYSEADSKYGYGCIVKRYNGARIVGHGGGWVGITNKFDMYPDLGYTVVILNNIDSDPNAIAFKLREWLTQGTVDRTP